LALSLDPNNGKILFGVVNYYLTSGPVAESLDYVERLAKTYPRSYLHLRKHPRWSKTVAERFKKGLEASLKSPLASTLGLWMLAALAAEEKDWAQAVKYTEKIVERIEPVQDRWLLMNLGEYYLKMGNREEAARAVIQGLRISDNRLQMLEALFWRYRRDSVLDFYIEIRQKTAKFDPFVRANLKLVLGKAYFAMGDLPAAKQSLMRSLNERETSEAHAYLAEIALKEEDWTRAELESQRAIALEPENYRSHYLLARSLQEQHKYEAALEAIEEAIKYSKGQVAYLLNTQGWLKWSLQRYAEAVTDWHRASRLDPDNVQYLRQIGKAYEKLKNYRAAERFYLSALKIKPDDLDLRQDLAAMKELASQGKSPASKK